MGYAFTGALVLGVCYALIHRKVDLLAVAAFFAVLVPYTLPGMHERYFYLGDVLTVVLACYRHRLWYVAVMVQVASLGAYTPPLFGWFHDGPSVLMMALALVMGAAVLILGHAVMTDAFSPRRPADPPASLPAHPA
jgi:hypothetical protein